MLELDGKFEVMISTQYDRDEVVLTFHDSDAGVIAFEATATRDDFAKALGRMGYLPCKIRVNDSGAVGMQQEHKTEAVFVKREPFGTLKTRAAAAVKKHEVDGWRGRVGDATNQHCVSGRTKSGNWYTVHFWRHVAKPGSEDRPLPQTKAEFMALPAEERKSAMERMTAADRRRIVKNSESEEKQDG